MNNILLQYIFNLWKYATKTSCALQPTNNCAPNSNLEEQEFLNIINQSLMCYFVSGARSSKKVDCLHNGIVTILQDVICKHKHVNYTIKTEQNVASCNSSTKKKCDIVIYARNKPYIIIPVKFAMTNIKKNINNAWENLTGECIHLKWGNDNIVIIPINIICDKVPCLNQKKEILRFETIDYNDVYRVYNNLITHNIVHDMCNYIVNIEHCNDVGEIYDKTPTVVGFSNNTKYRSLSCIIRQLL